MEKNTVETSDHDSVENNVSGCQGIFGEIRETEKHVCGVQGEDEELYIKSCRRGADAGAIPTRHLRNDMCHGEVSTDDRQAQARGYGMREPKERSGCFPESPGKSNSLNPGINQQLRT